jgi:hypothetical protein
MVAPDQGSSVTDFPQHFLGIACLPGRALPAIDFVERFEQLLVDFPASLREQSHVEQGLNHGVTVLESATRNLVIDVPLHIVSDFDGKGRHLHLGRFSMSGGESGGMADVNGH